VYQIWSL